MRPCVHLNRRHCFRNSSSASKVRRKLWLLPLFGLMMVTPGTTLFGQIRTETVAETGDTSPDGNGLFGGFTFNALINESGEVVFESNLTTTSGGTTDDLGIFREFDGSISQVVREGEPAPDGNGKFQFFEFPHIDNQGSVVFRSTLSDTSGGSADSTGIFEGAGGAIVTIARAGQPVPEGNGVFSTFTAPDSNHGNRMAFSSLLAETSGDMTDNSGIYLASAGTPANIVRSGEAAPDGNGVYSSFSTALTNSPGQVSFAANLTGTTGGATDDEGVFRASDETIVQVFRAGTVAPDGNGTFLSVPQTHFPINDLGQIAFEASLTGTSGGASDDGGIFRGSGGPLTQILRVGQPSPDGNGVFSGVGFAEQLNQSGQAAFVGTLTGTSGGTSDNLGLYVADGIETIQVAREGVLVPDSNGTIEVFLNDVYLNDSGVALFNPRLVGTIGGTADNSVILLSDGIETIQVARKGQMLDGSIVVALGFAISRTGTALNNSGQNVYVANLADGRSLVQRVTPELHWRSVSSGQWDVADNWTLGIGPGDVHDVIIDPDSIVSVIGPSGDQAIRSLVVGGGSGEAALHLQGSELAASETILVNVGATLAGTGQVNGVVEVEGNLLPGSSVGVLGFQGILKLRETSVLKLDIEGTNIGEFDQVAVLGDFSMQGELSVDIEGSLLAADQEYLIVDVSGNADGAFIGLNDGDVVTSQNGIDLHITYTGGDGNDVVLFTANGVLLGDVNLDGVINLLDVQPFVNLLVGGPYQAEADINQDGQVNLLDVSPFIAILADQ